LIAVDASVMIDMVLGAGSPGGDTVAAHLRVGEVLCAPHLIDAEVGQGLRRYVRNSDLSGDVAESLVVGFLEVPIKRYPHTGLLTRAFELRSNVTVYDGLYLALAEILDCPLLTGDGVLENVPGCQAVVEVLATSA
jgi:predicted nucleic acid-binding protein